MFKSEIYTVVSSGKTDFQPIDCEGARQTVFKCSPETGDGALTSQPFVGDVQFPIGQNDPPLIVVTNDGRLWFHSISDTPSTLHVWVIR